MCVAMLGGLMTTFGVFAAMPAGAVIGGTLDSSNIYSNVGLITVNGQHWCSGTLYRTSPNQTSSNLFLTAGHCTLGVTGQFKVTFDPAGDTNPAAKYYAGKAYTIPGFAYAPNNSNSLQNGNNVPDAGVVVLDQAVNITPADLPSVGLVDTLDVHTQLITTVGYGINDFSNANTFAFGPRVFKDVNITPGQRAASAGLYLKTTSGACSGDSGGPNFIKGTDTIAGVTSWGQSRVCGDNNYVYRIDSAQALSFLNSPATVGVPSS
jgi:Trypsin